ncbi:MAG: hypothetical protein HOH43_18240 [Candidatus Latescibacteria bacterium]|nr:hypothetical protein [Candidatus Latescibacterota bacterium]
MADESGVRVWETDYGSLMDSPELEAVSIYTSVHRRHEMASAAISAGNMCYVRSRYPWSLQIAGEPG